MVPTAEQEALEDPLIGPETYGLNNFARKLALAAPMLGMTVYHGSPHVFDAFKMAKVGTGEGGQAFGHGLYFAENPEVAKIYSGLGRKPNVYQLGDMVIQESKSNKAALQKAIASGRYDVKQLQKASPGGSLYHVDLPDESVGKMLDWDQPLSQHPEEVRAIMNRINVTPEHFTPETLPASIEVTGGGKILNENGKFFLESGNKKFGLTWDDVMRLLGEGETGANIYQTLARRLGSDEKASALLKQYGIPGIKYLDKGSRSAGQGTRNYVVFDETLPKVTRRK